MTLSAYITSYLDNVKQFEVKPSTIHNYKRYLLTIEAKPIGAMELTAVRTSHVTAFLGGLAKEGCSKGYITNVKALLSSAFKAAVLDGDLKTNPMAYVRTPPVTVASDPIEAFNAEEQKKLRAVLEPSKKPLWRCLLFILETGLRSGEARALNWSDVHLDVEHPYIVINSTMTVDENGDVIRGSSPKTKSSIRKIPISAKAQGILRTTPHLGDGVFLGLMNHERLEASSLRYNLRIACDRAGIERKSVHALRHTFATNQYYKGTNIKVISKLLGHANTSITYNTYVNLFGDGFDDMVNAVC